MRRLTILLSILILSQNSIAGPLLPGAVLINKGTSAPYDGVLLSLPMTQEIYKELQEAEVQKQVNISLNKSLSLMQTNEGIYKSEILELKTQNTKLDDALVKASSNSFWNRAMYFGLGVLTTGLIVYAARR